MAKEIYVGHLSELVTEEDVWKLFSVAGTVTSVHLIIDPETGEFKRCGYVRMAAGVSLDEVVETLDGAYLIDKEITVSIARPQVPGMSKNKNATNKPWLKPWLKPGPKPAKTGAQPGPKAAGERDSRPKAKPAAAASSGPKAASGREQRPNTRSGAPSPAAPSRGKRPGTGPRTPRAGK